MLRCFEGNSPLHNSAYEEAFLNFQFRGGNLEQ